MVTTERMHGFSQAEDWQDVHVRGGAGSKAKRGQEHRAEEIDLASTEGP